jgi:hypothetical protein
MPTIIFSPSAQLQQIDDFPADCGRTVVGAIHVAPGRTCVVSDDEAAHLKARGVVFSVAGAPLKPPAASRAGRKPAPAAPPPTTPLPGQSPGPFGAPTTTNEPE